MRELETGHARVRTHRAMVEHVLVNRAGRVMEGRLTMTWSITSETRALCSACWRECSACCCRSLSCRVNTGACAPPLTAASARASRSEPPAARCDYSSALNSRNLFFLQRGFITAARIYCNFRLH